MEPSAIRIVIPTGWAETGDTSTPDPEVDRFDGHGAPSNGASSAAQTTMLDDATAYEDHDPSATPVGELSAGDPVVCLQREEGWSLVSFGDSDAPSFGWVPSYAVAESEEPVEDALSVEDFEAPLARFGTWIDDPQHGRIWQPAPDVAGADFAPYASDGTWAVSDDGQWVFRSRWDDGFGWATYHYGRWVDHDRFGWVWVPGTHWAPAWVDWRHGGGHVGWVPLGPPGVAIPERHWTFVEERRFGAPGGVWRWRVPPARLHEVFVGASPLPRRPGLAWARGPAVATIRAAGSPVEVVRVSVPTSHAVRAQAAAALAHAAATGRPVVRPGGVTAVVRHGPNAGAAVPVVARPPAPPAVAVHRPAASPRPLEHPAWTVPHPLLAPHRAQATPGGSPLAPHAAPSPAPHPGPAGLTPGARKGTTPPPPQPSAGRPSPARPGPAPVNRQQSPARAHGTETGEAAAAYDGSRFVGGTLIAVWSPEDQRWIDVARTPPGPRGAHAGEEIGRAVAHTLSEANPGVVFVQLIERDPANPGIRILVARGGSIVNDQRAPGAAAPPWPAWTRASGIAPLPRANPFGLDGTMFAECARVALWLNSEWHDFAEVLPFMGIDLPARCGARVAGEFAKATGRTGRTKVVLGAGETGVTLFACEPGSACTSESFALGAAPAWIGEAAAPDSTPNENASPTTIGNPAAFVGGSLVSLWVPPSGRGPGRWEDVARTPPGERARRLADELGIFLVDILGGVAPGSAFGVVVHRSPETARGVLLVARPDGGRAHSVGFPAGTAPSWPAWVKPAERPFARQAGYAGDADIFEHGSLVSQYDRPHTRWDDLVESRPATAYDFGGTIARYLAQTTADRGQLVGLTRYVQRDPRAWTGTVLVASEPGGHPREEMFPAGTVPTWARLLAGGGEAGGPDTRVAALDPRTEMRAERAGEAGAPGAAPRRMVEEGGWTLFDPSWLPTAVRNGVPVTAANLAEVRQWHPELARTRPDELGGWIWWIFTPSKSELAYLFSPSEPWRGADYFAAGGGNLGAELPLITPTNQYGGKIVGAPFNIDNWGAGALIGSAVVDASGNSRPAPNRVGDRSYDRELPRSETGAPPLTDTPIGAAPATALEQLLCQIDRRYPYRGKGPLDGLLDNVLRITDDPGRIGALRSGPNLKHLERLLAADPRTHAMKRMSADGARYLAVVVKPSRLRDVAMWDLSGLSDVSDAGALGAGVEVEETGPWSDDVMVPQQPRRGT